MVQVLQCVFISRTGCEENENEIISFSQGEWFKTTMIEEKCYGNELWVLSLTFCRNNVVTTIVSTKFPGLKDEKHLTTFILNFTIFINL